MSGQPQQGITMPAAGYMPPPSVQHMPMMHYPVQHIQRPGMYLHKPMQYAPMQAPTQIPAQQAPPQQAHVQKVPVQHAPVQRAPVQLAPIHHAPMPIVQQAIPTMQHMQPMQHMHRNMPIISNMPVRNFPSYQPIQQAYHAPIIRQLVNPIQQQVQYHAPIQTNEQEMAAVAQPMDNVENNPGVAYFGDEEHDVAQLMQAEPVHQ